jgi:hypothetical protein
MPSRRPPPDKKNTSLQEEVTHQAKSDPRREKTGPNFWIGLIEELQRDVHSLKLRVSELEAKAGGEAGAADPPRASAKPSKPPSAIDPDRKTNRPPAPVQKHTKELQVPSSASSRDPNIDRKK